MAVGVQILYRGATLKQYDEVVEMLGLLPGGPPPQGVLFHCVAETDKGILIIDVWESRQALTRFQDERTTPLFHKVGVRDPPEIQFFDVHNFFVGRRPKP